MKELAGPVALTGTASTPWGQRMRNAGTVAGEGGPGGGYLALTTGNRPLHNSGEPHVRLPVVPWKDRVNCCCLAEGRSYRSQQSLGTSQASLATMAMYVVKVQPGGGRNAP